MILSDDLKLKIEENRLAALARKRKREESSVQSQREEVPSPRSSATTDKNDKIVKTEVLCISCGSQDVDTAFFQIFEELVCNSCKFSLPDYELIPQAELSSKYLLTEKTIKEMKFIEKTNPKRPGWAHMKLYLRRHAKERAFRRWGGEDGLAIEISKRNKEKFLKDLEKTKNVLCSSFLDSPTIEGKRKNKRSLTSLISSICGDSKSLHNCKV